MDGLRITVKKAGLFFIFPLAYYFPIFSSGAVDYVVVRLEFFNNGLKQAGESVIAAKLKYVGGVRRRRAAYN